MITELDASDLSTEDIQKLRDYVIGMTCLQRGIPEDEAPDTSHPHKKMLRAIKAAVAEYPADFLLEVGHLLHSEHAKNSVHTAHHVGGPLDHNMLSDYFYFSHLVKCYSMDEMRMLIRGLHESPHLPDFAQLSRADDETVSRCISMLRVTLALDEFDSVPLRKPDPYSNASRTMMVDDPALVKLALEHHEHSDLLYEAIRYRQTMDVGFLRSLLESPVPAVAEGIL